MADFKTPIFLTSAPGHSFWILHPGLSLLLHRWTPSLQLPPRKASNSVTRLGEFLPVGRLITLDSVLNIAIVAQIFGRLFSTGKSIHYIRQNMRWAKYGVIIFHKLIRSPWLQRHSGTSNGNTLGRDLRRFQTEFTFPILCLCLFWSRICGLNLPVIVHLQHSSR
jgi:hypothetical protein